MGTGRHGRIRAGVRSCCMKKAGTGPAAALVLFYDRMVQTNCRPAGTDHSKRQNGLLYALLYTTRLPGVNKRLVFAGQKCYNQHKSSCFRNTDAAPGPGAFITWRATMEEKRSMSQEEKIRARKKVLKKKRRKKVALIIVLVFVCIIAAGITFLFASGTAGRIVELYRDAKTKVAESTEDTFRASQASIVYDVNGNQISTVRGDKDVKYLESGQIPEVVKYAFVCTEDKKFYQHNGVDLMAILRAMKSIIENRRITQGGSTITQQLSRNVFLNFDKNWERKVEEIFIARELEKKYPNKDKILEFYINNINFANGYYGLESAAQGYFSQSASELDLAQLVFLCAIPNNPTLYDPLDNPENTIRRRDRILEQLNDASLITHEEYEAAVAENIILRSSSTARVNNYVETFVYYSATRALMEQSGFQFRYSFSGDADREAYLEEYDEMYTTCQKTLYTSGYHIYTSIDMDKQNLLQQAVDNTLAPFTRVNDEGTYKLQGAATCIENETGRVVAIVGGRTQDSVTGMTLNRAYQSFRQPGSSIKPLVVYTPVLETGEYTPGSMVDDYKREDGPSNSDGSYDGEITLRYAVAKSKNTIAYQLFTDLGPSTGLDYLRKLHFTKVVKEDEVPSTALGGMTKGASTLEMASGYAALANEGEFREPTCIIRILDAQGNTVFGGTNIREEVYDSNAARMMISMMQSVLDYGTGRGLELDDMPAAAKTGTTNDNKDGWFCGFTPYYTTSVWVGCDMPESLEDLQGATYPGGIWHDYMEQIHQGLPYREFPEYEVDGHFYDTDDGYETEPPEETEAPSEKPGETEAVQTEKPAETTAPENTPEPAAEPSPEPEPEPEPEPTEAYEPDVPDNENGEGADPPLDDAYDQQT